MEQRAEAEAKGVHRAIWALALPAMLTNLAPALFSLADLWVIGQLGRAEAMAAVEIGGRFMMALLIVFNFLRTATVALTAQAVGRGDAEAEAETLARALGLAVVIAAGVLAAMPLAIPFGLDLLHARGGFGAEARTYVDIRYWGALFWLINAPLVGWLVGRRRVKAVLAVEVAANSLHVVLNLLFALGLGWGVAGVALASLLSEVARTLALGAIAARQPAARAAVRLVGRRKTWERTRLAALFRLNRDLFLRTLLLTGAILLLTRDGAHEGALILAANAILYQLYIISALILDGFGSAAQVLCGEAVGARDGPRFRRLVRVLLLWGLAGGVALGLVYALIGDVFATSFSTDPAVVAAVRVYAPWTLLLPVVGVCAYIFDGIYIGATWTRAMVATMAAAFAVYGLLLLVTGPLGNHGLWLAFSAFFAARAVAGAALLPRLARATFASEAR